jgi:hypothetical protein
MLIQSNIVTKAPATLATSMTGNVVGAFLCTPQPNFGKVEMAASISANAYDAAIPTTTAPTSTGQTLLVYSPSNEDPNLLKITPYSSSSSAGSPMVRVIGWSSYIQSATTLYVPTLLAELTMSYSTATASVSVDGANRFFFHNITASSGVPTVNLYSPGTASAANNVPPAFALIDVVGSQFVTLQFKSSTTSSNICGALWCAI